MTPPRALDEALRIIVLTDRRLAGARGVEQVVASVLGAGVRAIQLRDKGASARELHQQAVRLLALTRPAGALLFVNDRLDVALAAGADGVHLGPDDLSVAAARRWVPPGFLIGYSTDDPTHAREAEAAGADYIGCGAVFPTRSKEVGDESIGTERLDEVAGAVRIPVVAIGGIAPTNVAEVAATRAAGVAVLSCVMGASDPAATCRLLASAFDRRPESS